MALVKNKPVEYKEIFYICPETNEEFYPEKIMDENLTRARDAYKRLNGLLTSIEIKEIRDYYGLNQKELSNVCYFKLLVMLYLFKRKVLITLMMKI